jgi:hypothetical protein
MNEGGSKADTGHSTKWWQTIPGMLTAFAAVLTAVTGLVVALRSGDTKGQEPPAEVRSATPSQSTASPQSTLNASNGVVTLPSGMEAKLSGGGTVIRVLSAQLQPFNREKRALVFSIRYTNNGRYPANFWVASYRLLLDDVPNAPTNDLNEVVAGESAKQGEVTFEVPVTATRAVLRISSGDERTDIPFDLPPPPAP